MKEIKLKTGQLAKVDDYLYEQLNQFNWMFYHGYAAFMRNGEVTKMHQMVLSLKGIEPIEVHHRNEDKLDNQFDNLLNTGSRSIHIHLQKKPSFFGRGVYYRGGRRKKPFHSMIMKDGIVYPLGSFKTREQAEQAYKNKEKELYG